MAKLFNNFCICHSLDSVTNKYYIFVLSIYFDASDNYILIYKNPDYAKKLTDFANISPASRKYKLQQLPTVESGYCENPHV